MTGVDILMVSVLLENTVQLDILEPCHGGNDKLSKEPEDENFVSHFSFLVCIANNCKSARLPLGGNREVRTLEVS